MVIRGVESPSDVAAVSGLIEEAFDLQPGMGAAYGRTYRTLMERDAAVTPDCSRVAEAQGKVVGHALVIPRRMGVSGVPAPAGIIAFVAVRQKVRRQGIGTALVEDAVRFMRERRFLISHLSGAPAFYRRFGYVEACGRSLGRMRVVDLASYSGHIAVRDAGPPDAAALYGLFEGENAGRTGCIRRDAAQWAWQLETGHPLGYTACNEWIVGFRPEREICLVAECGGKIVGYLRLLVGPGRVAIHEGAIVDGEAASALFAHVSEMATRVQSKGIDLLIPSDGSFGRWTVEQGATFEERLDPEALIKVLDAPALLARLTPIFTERVYRSALRGTSVRLLFETERDQIELRIAPEGMTLGGATMKSDWHVTLPDIGLTQMMFGTRDYAALMEGRADADRELTDWISVLFPVQRPYIYLGDMF
jgi:putative acetyltransferase